MDLIPWRSKGSRASESESSLARMRTELNDVFDRFIRDPWGRVTGLAGGATFPRVDIRETEDNVEVCAELPGIKPEDVNIEVTGNVLRLTGEKTEEREESGRSFRYTERQYGSFSRSLELPTSVDPNNVDATYADGLLTIRMAKRPEARPRRIHVHTAGEDPHQPARQIGVSPPAQPAHGGQPHAAQGGPPHAGQADQSHAARTGQPQAPQGGQPHAGQGRKQ